MTNRMKLLAALLASTATGVAHAQERPAVSQEAAEGNEIVVTAQKIEQRASDVPITISALSNARMRELGVSDLDELSAYVPGLNIQEQSANNPGIVIRGITSDSGSAQQAARVTLYYNGIDISRSRGAYQAVYDLDRVEVIKGPQATLFGTASAVGAISMVSARPRAGFSGELSGGIGNFAQRQLGGHLNLGSDVIAGRVAFEWKKRDGYVRNLSATQGDLYAQNQLGVRASLRFTPSDALTVDLIGTYDRQRNSGTPFISKLYPTARGPADPFGYANLSGSPLSKGALGAAKLGLNRHVYDGNLTISHDFADGWNFTTVNGYRSFDSLEIFDADGSAAWYLEFAEGAYGSQISHESRFAYSDDHVRASFGWNVFHENSRQEVPFSSEEGTYLQCAANVIKGLGCVAPDGTVTAAQATGLLTRGAATVIPYRSIFGNKGINDSYSMFGEVTWMPTARLEVTAGIRAPIEQGRPGYFAVAPKSVLTGAPLIPGQATTNGTRWTQDSFQAFLPRFNLLYRLSDGINLYGTISKGRRSPTVNQGAAAPSLIPEETVWNYEGGIKASKGIVSGSLGVYYQKYSNFQISRVVTDANDPSGRPVGAQITESAGSASNLGVEAELLLRPASWFSVFGNIGYINGGIDKTKANGVYAGNKFRLQPEVQAAGGFTVDAAIGGGLPALPRPPPAHPLHNPNERYLLDAGNTGGGFGNPTFIPAEPRFYGAQLTGRF